MGKKSSVNDIYGNHLFKTGLTNSNNPVAYEKAIEHLIATKLVDLCMNRFKWTGLPDSVSPRFLEQTLFYKGLSVFYFNEKYDKYMALQATPAEGVDMYNDPISYRVYGNEFVSETKSNKECVPIWANYTRTSEVQTVQIYARRLAKLDRTIEINTDNARQPRIIVTDENTQLSMENINRQIDAGVPTIKVRAGLDGATLATVLDMGVNAELFDKLGVMRARVMNECMTLLGINNANQDKKERLVADEVDANSEQVGYMKAVNLNARQYAAEQINKMFPDLSISVDYDPDFTNNYSPDNIDDIDIHEEDN